MGRHRRDEAVMVRLRTALAERRLPLPQHPTKGDDELYPNKVGSYSKVLPHNALGEVDSSAYRALISALASGKPGDFEGVPLGGSIKLQNPQASYAFLLEGSDSHATGLAAPPGFG
jgi:hypothetical protein